MDSSQSAADGSLLLQLVCLPGGLGQNSSLGDEDDMLATELLLQLSDQSKILNLQLDELLLDQDQSFVHCSLLHIINALLT